MRVVFFGTPQVAVPALESIAAAGHRVGLVVSQPDRPAGRSRAPQAPPIKRAALALGLEVAQPVKLHAPEFLDDLRSRAPQLLVVVAYGRILRRRLLDIPPLGAVNLHFSLLPRYRGAAPVQWALAAGETATGVTTMRIDEKLDEGDVLLQREVEIRPGEHCPALQERLAALGARLLVETLERLAAGTIEPRPQDPARASRAPLLTVADGVLDPALTAREVEGRVRGFDPWPGVWARLGRRRMRIVEAREVAGTNAAPAGTVVDLGGDGLGLACAKGTLLRLERLQIEGRKPVSVAEARRGRQLAPGDRLA